MSNASTVTGTVANVIRHGHTVYGNPMMSLALVVSQIDGTPAESEALVTVRVSDNASMVYCIDNPEYRSEPHTFALTRAGRISHVVR